MLLYYVKINSTIYYYIILVEDENTNLRTVSGLDKPINTITESDNNNTNPSPKITGQKNEVEILRDKVADLSRQKVQLTEHIAMVATENRQLWSRLSKLTKDSQSINKLKDNKDIILSTAITSNNLIRSKTFTQNSPNPMLRHKIPNDNDENEMATANDLDENTIGFGYLQDQDPDGDETTVKRVQEALLEFKHQMLNQQNELRVLYGYIQKLKGNINICIQYTYILFNINSLKSKL